MNVFILLAFLLLISAAVGVDPPTDEPTAIPTQEPTAIPKYR
jgi:hypothetical protein